MSRGRSSLPPGLSEWLRTAFSPTVRRRATRTMLVVGSVLVVINHAEPMLAGDFTHHRFLRILLTMAVPYIVSTVSSVGAILEMRRSPPRADEHPGHPLPR
jgi:hypothetical protein